MIFEFFVLGSFWFWGLMGLTFLLLLIEVANEQWGFAALTMIATVVTLQLFGDVSVLAWIKDNPVQFASGLVGYLGVGVVWAFIKWYLHVASKREEYDDLKRTFMKEQGLVATLIPEDKRVEWARFVCKNKQAYYTHTNSDKTCLKTAKELTAPPSAREHKSRIMSWMAYWPWSALWSLLDDFLRKLYERIYRVIVGTLQRIAEFAFRGVENDFDVDVPPTPLKRVSDRR